MFTMINCTVGRLFYDCASVTNKTNILDQYTPLLDIIIGIALCIIALLADRGFPIIGGLNSSIFSCIGAAQIIIGVFYKWRYALGLTVTCCIGLAQDKGECCLWCPPPGTCCF